MHIQFLGAVRTTTGSMHLVQVNGKRLLLDCGLYQGKRKEAFERNRNLPVDAKSIDAVVLSHAHIDHSGNLPTLVKKGFAGPIYATPATVDLCEIMLKDSAYLQLRDVEYVNRKRARQGKSPFESLYEQEDVDAALRQFKSIPYDTTAEVIPGVKLTFRDAGHILGSATVTLDISENGTTRRLFFTGDLGRKKMPILRNPVVVDNVDYLITESTYGNRLHPPDEDVKQELQQLCNEVAKRKVRMVIPAFSVGRTQQVLYYMHELWRAGRLPDIPVYVDSPLSTKATKIYEDHPECYDSEMRKLFPNDSDPFTFGSVKFTADVEESKQLNHLTGPVIIISASGMCEGGRVLHHLKHTIPHRGHIVLIVGFQAEHTLGRRLIEHAEPIRIYGEEFPLNAEVYSIQALSAHADRNEMIEYFKEMGPQVERAFVVHGDLDQNEPLAQALTELGARNVLIPTVGQIAEM